MTNDKADGVRRHSLACPDCGAITGASKPFYGSCGAYLGWESASPPESVPLPPERERPSVEPAHPAASAEVTAWVVDVTTSVSANAAWVLVGYGAKQAWARIKARVRRDHATTTPARDEAERAALARVVLTDKSLRRRDLTIDAVTVPREGPAVVDVLYNARGPGKGQSVEFNVEVIKRGGLIQARICRTRAHHR